VVDMLVLGGAVVVIGPLVLYVLARVISSAVFRSYFEVKREMEKKEQDN